MNNRCDSSRTTFSARGEDGELAQLAQALGHPARVAIVRLLKGRESCICGEIVAELPSQGFSLAQSTVSQHLKVLKEAGWIQGEVDGPRTCYCLNPLALEKLSSLIAAL
jgi:DNA-binding transcriptional ArsR family regulator